HQGHDAQDARGRARLDDSQERPRDLLLIDGKLLGQLGHDLPRRVLAGQHEADQRDPQEQDRDQRHQEEERETRAHEEPVRGEEARERASSGARGHSWRKKWARSPPLTSNRRTLLSRMTSKVSASPGSGRQRFMYRSRRLPTSSALRETITSPSCSPPRSPGPSGTTPATTTPSSMTWAKTPSQARR